MLQARSVRRLIVAVAVGILAMATRSAPMAADADGEALVNGRCAACHERLPDGGLNRISHMRKTPEGWDMTLVRMMQVHGVTISPKERALLVRYFADKQGLAPEETAPFRYILERRPNVIEDIPAEGDIGTMCARCHSYARIAVQRRDADEWLKLVNFHMGQWPTIEYQSLGRDRNWWEIASQQVPQTLGKRFPFKTDAWSAWAKVPHADLAGTWRIVGHQPGVGDYMGTMTVERQGDGEYATHFALNYADGTKVEGTGTSIVYTGYEWRGSTQLGDDAIHEVYAVSDGGNIIEGRWFLADADEIGGDFKAVRERDGHAQILAVEPSALKAGSGTEVTIVGTGLSGDVSLGEGVRIAKTLSQDANAVRILAEVSADASAGARAVAVGDTRADGVFAVYDTIDSVRVEPAYGIGRVGGGPIAPVAAQFDAVAYLNGPDGKPGTDDDIRLAVMPATWTVGNFNDVAAAMHDVKFAGAMQPDGLFVPAVAGPNPQRTFSTNNAGDLQVKATVKDDDRTLEGTGRLVVTVQRWNDPPIR